MTTRRSIRTKWVFVKLQGPRSCRLLVRNHLHVLCNLSLERQYCECDLQHQALFCQYRGKPSIFVILLDTICHVGCELLRVRKTHHPKAIPMYGR